MYRLFVGRGRRRTVVVVVLLGMLGALLPGGAVVPRTAHAYPKGCRWVTVHDFNPNGTVRQEVTVKTCVEHIFVPEWDQCTASAVFYSGEGVKGGPFNLEVTDLVLRSDTQIFARAAYFHGTGDDFYALSTPAYDGGSAKYYTGVKLKVRFRSGVLSAPLTVHSYADYNEC